METGQLTCIQATDELDSVLDRIIEILETKSSNGPVRLCIRSLGSPEWGGVGGQVRSPVSIMWARKIHLILGHSALLALSAHNLTALPTCVCIFDSSTALVYGVGWCWVDPEIGLGL